MESKKKFWLGVIIGACGMLCVSAIVCGIIFFNSSNTMTKAIITEDDGLGDETLNTTAIGKNISLLESMIDEYFILDYNKTDLEQGVYKGLVAALNDPFSEYYTAEEAKEYQDTMKGSYCGIGATISESSDGEKAIIVDTIGGGPAEKAGIISGDVIVGVDYESVSGLSTEEIVNIVRGEEGTTVAINITRNGDRMDFDVTREKLSAPQVSYEIKDNIGYIAINQFVGTAAEETLAAINDLKSQGATKLIIDLRNNVGGSLEVLLSISNYFLDEGEVIIKEVDKKGNSNIRTADGGKVFDGDIVVLTNGYTASASEGLTAALHDNGKAIVVGTQTYGKGIVQDTMTLSSGAALKLTVEYYYTPNDVCIHKVGITPDYVIEYDASSGEDNQLAKAIELLEER